MEAGSTLPSRVATGRTLWCDLSHTSRESSPITIPIAAETTSAVSPLADTPLFRESPPRQVLDAAPCAEFRGSIMQFGYYREMGRPLVRTLFGFREKAFSSPEVTLVMITANRAW